VAVKELFRVDDLGSENSWHTELDAMTQIAKLDHTHILRLIAGFRRGEDRYLVFEWADRGSLKDIWTNCTPTPLSRHVVGEWLYQLRGLADALNRTHNHDGNNRGTIRNGNLKPENILVCNDGSTVGVLKIGDWGLAKKYLTVTEMRSVRTTMQYGTSLYEAPETVVQDSYSARSRLCNIWSLGCVYLEHLIWLLYGDTERRRFVGNLQDEQGRRAFYQITRKNTTMIHKEVIRWLDHMLEQHPEGTYLGDFVMVIKTKLLVIALPLPQRFT
jgi:serine/threonine protein kinase